MAVSRFRSVFPLFFLAFIALLPQTAPAADISPQWAEHISAQTAGLVSRKGDIHIVFVHDVVAPARVNQPAGEILRFSPAMRGAARFITTRELVWTPAADFTGGEHYEATLQISQLDGIPAGLGEYKFGFSVIKPDFEVTLGGLTPNPQKSGEFELAGTITTADTEAADQVERMLTAQFMGRPLSGRWRHEETGQRHDFTISGIQRQNAAGMVNVAWSGAPIGVEDDGQRMVEIPARRDFKVLDVQAVTGGGQYVQLRFSDEVDPRQNLNGLITLSIESSTRRVEGNLVKVYPSAGTITGEVVVRVDGALRSTAGERVGAATVERTVAFSSQNPAVRFIGKGAILPDNKKLTIPFEAINANSVQVTAFRVYSDNMGQFLQTNTLGGERDLDRVGRYLWRKTITLPPGAKPDQWNRYALDATELLAKYPGALFRLTLSLNRGNARIACSEEDAAIPVPAEAPLKDSDDDNSREYSSWDYAEEYYGDDYEARWRDRENPCKDAFYRYSDQVRQARNFIASNIGLLAKRDDIGRLNVVATDLRTAEPLAGVNLDLRNYQNQRISQAVTDAQGFASLKSDAQPFYLAAARGGEVGYLKLSQGSALPVSHFDVGGVKINRGVNGYIYGERGVWRPGDNIYLTFVLQDKGGVIPDSHPVTMQLLNPQNQLVQTVTNNNPVGGFYTFTLKTREDAPTGNWTARALLGGATYTKSIAVETVVPNRLKIDLDFGGDTIRAGGEPLKAKLFAQWLHGATAGGLKADVSMRLASQPTRFTRYADFVFDDPARTLESERKTIFEGELDSEGKTAFDAEIEAENAPGMLDASFTSRVYEQGGAFSISRKNATLHPYTRYVGIKLPKGDATRGMLLTDRDHTVEVATVDPDGKPVAAERVEVTLYKIDWKWWWDKSGDSLADYARGEEHASLSQSTIGTRDGRGQWKFQVKYPDWGRYLVRACDLDGGHCTGQIVYIDWPGWAGRAVEQSGPGASMLTLFSDKPKYQVGETAEIHLPDASRGRALFTVESSSGILEQRWLALDGKNNVVKLPLTRAMSPNVYASVMLVQPHQEKKNDLPIRLYGVIPLEVQDPQSELKPAITAADEWGPRSLAKVKVSEQNGRAMTYTLAIVDEGLLGLTNYATPDLRSHFYKREALGITTWDLFDDVVGAYGGELERLLALGGSDAAAPDEESDAKRRFPPVVKFMGPFKLAAGKTNSHEFELPQYLGAVRVMVVAGEQGAYGRAEKSVPVREAVSMLVTLPRVLRPTEEITVPVSLFVQNPNLRSATVQVIADPIFEVLDGGKAEITIQKPGEQLAFLKLKVKPQVGKGALRFTARAGTFRTESQVFINVVNANPPATKRERKVIAPGESWDARVVPIGVEGTNRINLEVTGIPPIDLDRRLRFLIQYPHGCVEQTTSSVFPQIYLPQMMQLSDKERQEIERNVSAGIDRLRAFQGADGGFRYWPGAGGEVNPWANNYVGHFLLEAQRLGYFVPKEMLDNWKLYQLKEARGFNVGNNGAAMMEQAYRLYTLALARTPEASAMNRLYQSPTLQGTARWQLAAAYKLMSMTTASDALIRDLKLSVAEYKESDPTFGSALRDKAIILDALLLLGRTEQAQAMSLDIAKDLSSESWYSTQSTAYALFALSRMYSGATPAGGVSFEYALGSGTPLTITSQKPIYSQVVPGVPLAGETLHLKNGGQGNLYATVTTEGVPPPGDEPTAASNLGLQVEYAEMKGGSVEAARLPQGKEFIVRVKVTNPGNRDVKNLALTQVMPAGWEIHNARMEGASGRGLYDYQDVRDDRLLTYFGLKAGETKTFDVVVSSTYLGRYYLPGVAVEAMYDATREARSRGQWVEVVRK